MTQNRARPVEVPDVSLPAEAVDATAGPNLLVCGPPMTDKLAVMLELLSHVSDRTAIITTKHPADAMRSAHRSVAGEERPAGVVDAVNSPGLQSEARDDGLVRYAGTPGNLTRIGIEFSLLVETMEERSGEGRLGVGLHTLDPLTVHSGLQPVYRFLGTLTGRTRRADDRSVIVLDTPVAEYDVDSFRHHFDGVIETRTTERGQAELRVSSPRRSVTEWTTY